MTGKAEIDDRHITATSNLSVKMKPKISILDEAFVYSSSYARAVTETWRRFGWRQSRRDEQKLQTQPRVEQGIADAEERKRGKHWRIAMKAVEWILRQLRSLCPYLAVELFLPGGSIVGLLLWTYRHRTAARPAARRSPGQYGQLRRCGIGRSDCR